MNVFLHAGMNLSNRSQIKNRKRRHFRLVCFLKHWQSLHKSTQSQYLKLRDWPKSMWGRGGGPEQRGGGWWGDSWPHLLCKTQPAGIIAKILMTGRTSLRAWTPLLTFFLWLWQECPLMIFLFGKEVMGGSLKNYWSYGNWLVLYKIPFFHSRFLYSRHWWLVLCHEWQYFFFLLVVLF